MSASLRAKEERRRITAYIETVNLADFKSLHGVMSALYGCVEDDLRLEMPHSLPTLPEEVAEEIRDACRAARQGSR